MCLWVWVWVYGQAVQVGAVTLGAARLGGQYGGIQCEGPQWAVVAGRALWVGVAWAIAAEVAGDGLQLLPVSRPQAAADMAGRLERQARI